MNKNIQSFLKFAALPAFLLTVLPALFLTSCGGGGSNSSSTKTTGVDLIPDDFAVSPTSVVKDTNVTLSLKVKNQGTAATSGAVTVTFYKSADETITSDDEVLTDTSITSLDGGALSDELSTTATEDTAKSVFYGACVVTTDDTDTSNDCTAGKEVIFTETAKADLGVDQFAVNPDTAVTGGDVVLSVRVRNVGSADSVAETLTYYRASSMTADGTAIAGKDDDIGVLTAGVGEESHDATVQVPNTAGTYYYYACVTSNGTDSAEDTNSNNDCSSRVAVSVTAAQSNLTLGALTVGGGSTASVTVGEDATFAVTVTNEGNIASASETLTYYSNASNSTTGGTATGTVKVSTLTESGTSSSTNTYSDTSTLTVTGTVGTTYYYYACVSTGSTTNCSNTVAVSVTAAPPQAANLTLGTLTVGGGSTASITVGGTADFAVIVTNEGNIASASETLTYYSNASNSTTGGTATGTVKVSTLTESGTSSSTNTYSDTSTLTVTGTVGTTYYYYACVSTGSTTNCSNTVAVSVTAAPPQAANLTLGTLTVGGGSTASITVGGTADFAVIVTNEGNIASGSETLKYYRSDSNSSDPQPLATSIKSVTVDVLTDSGTTTNTYSDASTLTVTGTVGTTYYYFACVSTGSTTNCSNTVAVEVTAAQAANLTLGALTVNTAAVTVGGSADFTVTVTNEGNIASASETLTYYSNASNSTTGGTATGTVKVSTLTESGTSSSTNTYSDTSTLTVTGTVGTTYYYYACVSTGTATNCSNTVAVTVSAVQAANLTLGTLTVGGGSTASITVGGTADFAVIVTNEGNIASGSETLKYYRSDSNSSDPQPLATSIKSVTVDVLTDSGTTTNTYSDASTLTVTGTVGTTYYYYACVSTGTATNCSNTVAVTVSAVQAANLTLGTLTVNNSSIVATVAEGGSADFTVTVTNKGNADSESETLTYYSNANNNTTDGTAITGVVTVNTLTKNGTIASTNTFSNTKTFSVLGTVNDVYYYYACVTNTGGTVDCSNTVGVGVIAAQAADLTLGTLTVGGSDTASIAVDGDAAFAVTVTNEGNIASVEETLSYYRSTTDSNDPQSLTSIKDVTVSALTKSGTDASTNTYSGASTLTVTGHAGTYYYYACVTNTGTATNCSNTVAVGVTAALANLTLGTLTVGGSSDTASITVGGDAAFAVIVTNGGNIASGSETLSYYRSTTASNNPQSLTSIESVTVSALTESGTATNTYSDTSTLTVAGPANTYYYFACVTNTGTATNCSNIVEVIVNTPPDPQMGELTIADDTVDSDSNENVEFSVQVENIGGVSSVEETLQYYLSENSNVITSPVAGEIVTGATVTISALDANGVAVGDKSFSANGGVYYYYACVTSTGSGSTADSNLTNNCSKKVKVIVLPAPDLEMGKLSGTQDLILDQNVTFSARVYNVGSASSAAETLKYYRSASNNSITSPVAAEAVGTGTVGEIAINALVGTGVASGSATPAKGTTFPAIGPPGVYYYYACVTSTGSGSTADSNPDNNCTSKIKVNVGVTGNETPDLSLFGLALATPTDGNVQSNSDITLSFKVVNIGDWDSGTPGTLTFDYYRSTDSAAIVPADDGAKKISSVTTTNVDTSADAAVAAANLSNSDAYRELTSGSITVPTVANDTTYYYTVCVSSDGSGGYAEEVANNNNNCDQLQVDVIGVQ